MTLFVKRGSPISKTPIRRAESLLPSSGDTAELACGGLMKLGLAQIDSEHVQKCDWVKYVGELQDVGRVVPKSMVFPGPFKGFA
jgi:hypothetical protein